MGLYIVRFLKTVAGDHGDEAERCQWWVEVDAKSKADAADQAKRKFCALEKLSHWTLRADRVEVLESDFPS